MEDKRLYEDQIDLYLLFRDIIKGAIRFWGLLLGLTVLGASFICINAKINYTPMYQSQATFTVMMESDSQSGIYGFYYDASAAEQLSATFPYILSSELLTDAIKSDLNTAVINGSISAETVGESNMITMSVTGPDAEETRKILESAVKVYPEVAKTVIGSMKFNMIQVPSEPQEPYNVPDYMREAFKGACAGLMCGILFILLYALMKKTIQDVEELKSVSKVECLAKIPKIRKRDTILSVLEKSVRGNYKEAVKTAALRVERAMEEVQGNVILVTSTIAGEGKSTLCGNIACTLAQQGKKILWIDGDFRKQKDWMMIQTTKEYGIQELVNQECCAEDVITKEKISGLHFIGGKEPVSNVPALLNSAVLKEKLDTLKKEYDYVLVDTPPVENFDDVETLSEYADAILYVVKHDFVQRRRVLDSLASLSGAKAKIIGYLYNSAELSSAEYGYGRYGYGRYGYGRYGYGKYGYGEKND